jgi:hypothetical protein
MNVLEFSSNEIQFLLDKIKTRNKNTNKKSNGEEVNLQNIALSYMNGLTRCVSLC